MTRNASAARVQAEVSNAGALGDGEGGTAAWAAAKARTDQKWVIAVSLQPAPAGDDVCVKSEWRHAGHRTYDVTLYCLWRQNPGVTPDRIRFQLVLDESENTMSGPFKYLFSDPIYPPGRVGLEFEFTLESTRLELVPYD